MKYLEDKKLEPPVWHDPKTAYKQFSKTGCLDWIPDCPKTKSNEMSMPQVTPANEYMSKQPKYSMTATPIVQQTKDKKELQKIIENIHHVPTKCLIDGLEPQSFPIEVPELRIIQAKLDFSSEKTQLVEIADNPNHTYTAFIAWDDKPFHDKLFLKNHQNNQIQQIPWEVDTLTEITHILWVGEDILTFVERPGPKGVRIQAVDVIEEKWVGYWIWFTNCPGYSSR